MNVRRLIQYLVGEREQIGWQIETLRPGGFEIDHQFELGRPQHRQIDRLAPLNSSRVDSRLEIRIQKAVSRG